MNLPNPVPPCRCGNKRSWSAGNGAFGHFGRWNQGTKGVRAAFWLLVGVIGVASPKSPEKNRPLSKVVERFEFHGAFRERGHIERDSAGGVPEAVVALAQHSETPINVEALPPSAPLIPIEVNFETPSTVGKILDAMMERDPRYQVLENEGIVEVRPLTLLRGPQNCLDTTVPRFRIAYPWVLAWRSVECLVEDMGDSKSLVPSDPSQNCGRPLGEIPRCQANELVELDLVDAKLAEIASRVVGRGGNFAWVADYGDDDTGCASLRLKTYQPAVCYPFVEWISEMVKGLPPRCRTCHYHAKPSD